MVVEPYLVSTSSTYSSYMPYDYNLELQLEVADSEQHTSISNKFIVNLDAESSEDIKPLPIISISPNPVQNKQLKITANKDYEMDSYITIADNTGMLLYNFQKVKIKKDNEIIFNVGRLTYGNYILNITFTNGESHSFLFIVK